MDILQNKTKIGDDTYIIADILADSKPISIEQREGGILAIFPEVEVFFKEDSVEQAKRNGDARSAFRSVSSLDQLNIGTTNAVPVKETERMSENIMVNYTNGRLTARPIPKQAWDSLGTFADTIRSAGTVTEEQLVVQYNSLSEGEEKADFAKFLHRFQIPVEASAETPIQQTDTPNSGSITSPETPIQQDNSSATESVANNEATPSVGGISMINTPVAPAPLENTPSSVFNKPGEKPKKPPKTPKAPSATSLALKADYEKDEQLAASINKRFDQDAVEVLRNLGDVLKVFDGKVGVYAAFTASDTRIKAEFPCTIPAKERVYGSHVSTEMIDPSQRGSKIPTHMSNTMFKMNLVESAPGVIQGFAIYAPPGVTASMLDNFHSEIQRQELAHVLNKAMGNLDPTKYELVFISRKRFTSLLRFLDVAAVEVDHAKRQAITGGQTWQIQSRRNTKSHGYSNILKGYKNGVVARPSGANFIPIKTFRTAPVAQSDPEALSNFIFKSMFRKMKDSDETYYSRLEESSKVKFGSTEPYTYQHFADKQRVKSYFNSEDEITMPWPYLPPKATDEETTTRVTPEKVNHNDDHYNQKFRNRKAVVEPLFPEVTRARKSTAGGAPKVNLQLAKTEALAAMLAGTDLGDKDFDATTFA